MMGISQQAAVACRPRRSNLSYRSLARAESKLEFFNLVDWIFLNQRFLQARFPSCRSISCWRLHQKVAPAGGSCYRFAAPLRHSIAWEAGSRSTPIPGGRSLHLFSSSGNKDQSKSTVSEYPIGAYPESISTAQEATPGNHAEDPQGTAAEIRIEGILDGPVGDGVGDEAPADIFSGYGPTELVGRAISWAHDYLDCSWITALAVVALLAKLLFLGLDIYSNILRMRTSVHSKEIRELTTKITFSTMTGDIAGGVKNRAALEEYKRKNNIPKASALLMTSSGKIFIPLCFLMALRSMASASPPGYTTGGVWWFPDLSQPDPFYILPAVAISLGVVLNIVSFYLVAPQPRA